MIRLFEITLAAKIPNAESWAKPEPDLGRFHKAMRLRKTNPDFARSELQYLAGQGSRLSNLLLGNISEEDEPVNCSEAEIYYRKAAQQGSLAAFLFLGKLFLRQKRMDEAFAALSFAANKGYAPAMHWLGRVYLDGYGVERDRRRGQKLLETASRKGSVMAKVVLGASLIRERESWEQILRGIFLRVTAVLQMIVVLIVKGPRADHFR